MYLFSAYFLGSSLCIVMANTGNCEFYKECVEKEVLCGDSGYAMGYAYKYCNRFGTYYNDFTADVSLLLIMLIIEYQ